MSTSIINLEKAINSALTTKIVKSEINFNQLIVTLDFQNLVPTILSLKTNSKFKFQQLVDITAVDYPQEEKRFKIVFLTIRCQTHYLIFVFIWL